MKGTETTMTDNEKTLINIIRSAEDPAAALVKAVEIILEVLNSQPPQSSLE